MNNRFRYDDIEYFLGGEEPDFKGDIVKPVWNLNPELKSTVLKDMPSNLPPEHKALFIYFRLCKTLRYDEGYMYSDRFGAEDKEKYTPEFSKERIESIKPGDSVTCYDFARIYCKFINDLKIKGLRSVYKLHGSNYGHASMEFQTKNVSVSLEPILIEGFKQTNDLMNARVGSMPDGVKITSDKTGQLQNYISSIYSKALGEEPTSLDYRLLELKTLTERKEPNQVSLEDKLKSFVDIMKEKDIRGNEAVQLLINYNKYGFFDDKIKIALCAEKSQGQKGGIKFARKALIRKDEGNNPVVFKEDYQYFLLDTQSLDFGEVNPEHLTSDFISGLYTFESEKQEIKMPEMYDGGMGYD